MTDSELIEELVGALTAIKIGFERQKEHATNLRDCVFLDGVLSVVSTIVDPVIVKVQSRDTAPDQFVEPNKIVPDTHRYQPDENYPWFCKQCGYTKHNDLQHGEPVFSKEVTQ